MTPWIIGNWKLNPASVVEATALTMAIAEQSKILKNSRLVLAPSSLHLYEVQQTIIKNNQQASDQIPVISAAAQDLCAYTPTTGAYTGDISAQQLADIGIEWVIIGHSERRQYYHEDNARLTAKMRCGFNKGLGIVFCVGESQTQYLAGETEAVLSLQLNAISALLNKSVNASVGCDETVSIEHLINGLIVAYEPVWAIGTGKIPRVEEVSVIHDYIRSYLIEIDKRLMNTPILYGGSVNSANAAQFAGSSAINGVLVGGAALAADSFIQIAMAFDKR